MMTLMSRMQKFAGLGLGKHRHGRKVSLLLALAFGIGTFAVTSRAVVGGTDVPDGQFPFMTSLQFKGAGTSPLERHGCGASLVSSTWVLTAAHCLLGTEPSDIEVVVGRTRLSNTGHGEVVGVKSFVSHPKFPQASVYDIALLQLERPVTAATPIGRVAGNERLEDSEPAMTAVGWGETGAFLKSDGLQQASMPRISDAACADFNPHLNPMSSFCIGVLADGGPFPHSGDSGGPVFANRPGRGFVQLGVVSQAIVIVRLSNPEVAEFIESTIRD